MEEEPSVNPVHPENATVSNDFETMETTETAPGQVGNEHFEEADSNGASGGGSGGGFENDVEMFGEDFSGKISEGMMAGASRGRGFFRGRGGMQRGGWMGGPPPPRGPEAPPRFRGRGFGGAGPTMPPPFRPGGGPRGGAPPPLFPPPRGVGGGTQPPPGFNGPPQFNGPPGGGGNWPPPGMNGPPPGQFGGPPGMMGGPPPPGQFPPTINSNNPLAGIDANSEIWVETKSPDGKCYYYNARSRETSWTKPEGPNQKVLTQEQVEAMAHAHAAANQNAANNTNTSGATNQTTTAAQAALAQAKITNNNTTNKPEGDMPLDGGGNMMMGPPPGMAPFGAGPPTGGGPPPFGMPPPGWPGAPGQPPPWMTAQGPPPSMAGGGPPPGGIPPPWVMPPALLTGMHHPPQHMSGPISSSAVPHGALQAIDEAAIMSKVDSEIIARASEWTEHRAPDGRFYFYHAKNGESVWEKPPALKELEAAKQAVSASLKANPDRHHHPPSMHMDMMLGKNALVPAFLEATQQQPTIRDPKKDEEERLKKLQEEAAKRKREEEEKSKEAQKQDKSRPVSSTPVPGTPWCVVWTGDGRVFFYNPSSRTSVWERPEDLVKRADVDKLVAQPPEVTKPAPTTPPESADGGDSEKQPQKGGKSRPLEGAGATNDNESEATPIKKPKVQTDSADEDENETILATPPATPTAVTTNQQQATAPAVPKKIDIGKDAAIEAEVRAAKERAVVPLETRIKLFKEMLSEKSVSAFSTWEKELHKIVFDSRYLLLTSKERKQVFERYVKERAEEERREKRNKLREKKDAFRKLLSEVYLHGKSSYNDFAQKYGKDERFKGVEKSRERESLFNEYIIDVRKREKDEKNQRKEQVKRDFLAMLREHTDIYRHSHWMDVKRKLDQDVRYKAVESSGMREEWFRDYCKILKEEKKKQRSKDKDQPQPAQQQHSKHHRDKDKHKEKRHKEKDKEQQHHNRSSATPTASAENDQKRKESKESGGLGGQDDDASAPSTSNNTLELSANDEEGDGDGEVRKAQDDGVRQQSQSTVAANEEEEDDDAEEGGGEDSDAEAAAVAAQRQKDKERQARAAASLREREKEVQRTLATHMRDRDKEREQHKRDEAVQHFNALLADLVRNTDLNWREVKRILRKDHRWELADALTKDDRERLYNEHVEYLMRKKRDKFHELLDDTAEVTLSSSWKEIKRIIKEDPRYTKFSSSTSEGCEREFKDYLRDKLIAAKAHFRELLQETKLLTHKSMVEMQEKDSFIKEIEDILKNDKRYLVLECIGSERTKLIVQYLEELDWRGPPPPPTASEPNRRSLK